MNWFFFYFQLDNLMVKFFKWCVFFMFERVWLKKIKSLRLGKTLCVELSSRRNSFLERTKNASRIGQAITHLIGQLIKDMSNDASRIYTLGIFEMMYKVSTGFLILYKVVARKGRSIEAYVWGFDRVVQCTPIVLSCVRGKKFGDRDNDWKRWRWTLLYFVMALGPLFEDFTIWFRLVIIIDGTFLKDMYRGDIVCGFYIGWKWPNLSRCIWCC